MQYARMGLLYVGKPMKCIIWLKSLLQPVIVQESTRTFYLRAFCGSKLGGLKELRNDILSHFFDGLNFGLSDGKP